MIQFYAPEIETTGMLPEGESAHCCRVLRMRQGDEIYVTDGRGARFLCRINDPHPSHTEVSIIEKIEIPEDKGFSINLAVAPTKNADRMEWLAEKAVELGVDCITLLKCHRSERKIMKSERLRKVMVSAMKQSLGNRLPQLVELTDFNDFIKSNADSPNQKFFGYCSADYPKKEFAKECKPGNDVVVMIGPEGDFSEKEVELAVENGFMPVSFGERRLRTETAGVFAVAAVNVINQIL